MKPPPIDPSARESSCGRLHAYRQTHHQIPGSARRCTEHHGRARPSIHRAGASARSTRRATGWFRAVALATGRRQRAAVVRQPRGGDQAPARSAGHRRPGAGRSRSRGTAQSRRQGGAEAQRRVRRERDVPARGGGRQGRRRSRGEGGRTLEEILGCRDRCGAWRVHRQQCRLRIAARGAEEIHDRPHRARASGQARPGHRPRRRDPPRDPDPAAPDQEQSGADRRAGRRQDRDRRRARAAHRQRRSARVAQEQAGAGARHRAPARRCEVSRRVRGAPEGGAVRHREGRRPDHRLHRRTPHHGGRRARPKGRSTPATC